MFHVYVWFEGESLFWGMVRVRGSQRLESPPLKSRKKTVKKWHVTKTFAIFATWIQVYQFMKIIATSDWHLGNLFHGNDRLPEHRHFLQWLLNQIVEQKPDALLVAGDVFDNGNPSAASQSTYYEFLADVTRNCPNIQIVITAGDPGGRKVG